MLFDERQVSVLDPVTKGEWVMWYEYDPFDAGVHPLRYEYEGFHDRDPSAEVHMLLTDAAYENERCRYYDYED